MITSSELWRKFVSSRRSAARPNIFGSYMGNGRVIVGLPNGAHLFAFADDLSITPELMTRGMYDWPFWRFLHRHLRRGDLAVDVGANIGLFTVAMASIVGDAGHVYAFEPDQALSDLLDMNVTSNWLGKRVTLVRAAATDAEGSTVFAKHPTFLGSSSAGGLDLSTHAVGTGYQELTVPCTRIDSHVSGRVRLVKIDVEGGEARALRGLSDLSPDLVDVEIVRENAHDWDDLVETMRLIGGTPHTIGEDGSLSPVAFSQVIDRGAWPHIVFA